ncbi:hypothetical protein [Paracoccus aminophilus]|uniref:Uncharacterized protein n=1 Tax=Paracoccus aminophilus JCM 7686 TaxID=1367847 RepID=S5XWC4_PARAH|nr:hypothetical protein [Paracoccus aminophilus]AGT09572.1 hypothetical protein JCM7686_2504 [Paracoccus aminophilus JCM 7686]
MKKLTRIIGAGLLALAALAMIAGDLLAHGRAEAGPFTPTTQKFVLNFDMFAPSDLSCEATGAGVRSKATRDLAGKPVLRVTGNASGADIQCARADGTRYRVTSNRTASFTPSAPTEATVTFERGQPAMTTVLRIQGHEDVYDFKSFVRVD